jgi:hypothetical protein
MIVGHGRSWPIASFVVVQYVQQIKHFGRRAIEARNHAGIGQRIQELVAELYRTPPELTKRLADMLRRASIRPASRRELNERNLTIRTLLHRRQP